MAKTKTTFFCQNCGAQSPQWMGKCKSCNEWNTIIEEVVSKPKRVDGKVKPQAVPTKHSPLVKFLYKQELELTPLTMN